MLNVHDLLKLNATSLLVVGTILIVLPDASNHFFNGNGLMPKMLILSYGLGLNLCGLLLSYLARNKDIPKALTTTTIAINVFAALVVISILTLTSWLTAINAITASGLWIILLSWLSWNIHKAR